MFSWRLLELATVAPNNWIAIINKISHKHRVEMLTLKVSFEQLKNNFFKNIVQKFHKLKSLNILYANIEWGEFETAFKNNPDIENLVLRRITGVFDCKLLESPKVKILVLDTFDWYLNNIDALQTLHQITKLQINCERENLNNLIGELAQKGSVEEMELYHIKVDDKFFDILKTFDHLQLLSIDFADGDDDEYDPKNWKLTTAFTCLSRLKYLRLVSFEFTLKGFISTIRQLKCLEKFDLSGCSIARSDKSEFKDFAKLSKHILGSIVDTNRQQRLDIVMPEGLKLGGKVDSPKMLKGSDQLRVFAGGFGSNVLEIEIKSP